MKKLILIRGLPGSGKSTLAKTLMFAPALGPAIHLEADQYFMRDGRYEFDSERLSLAHRWCEDETDKALTLGPVIVSNTFTTVSELRPYFRIAASHGIVPQVITCENQWTSVHQVPEETMTKMKTRFAHDISELYEALNHESIA